MSCAIVIPARWASTRLPQKMLLNETGWPLIRHTYERARQSKLASQVLIATDDVRIFDAVKAFNAPVVMTRHDHPTGTDRLAEVASQHLQAVDYIVNVQGDEVEIEADDIDALIQLVQTQQAPFCTLATPFESTSLLMNPNAVKVVLGKPVTDANHTGLGYEALYFSRSVIPFSREGAPNPSDYFHHLGVYAYTVDFLKTYVTLPQTPLESIEKLEQLRALESGYRMAVKIVPHGLKGVDTREDYDAFLARWRQEQNSGI